MGKGKKPVLYGKELDSVSATENGILANLWRRVIFENGLETALPFLVKRYTKEGGKKSQSTIVSSITASELTWKNFIFLLFEILKVKKIRLTLEIDWGNDTKSVHAVEVVSNKTKDSKGESDGREKESRTTTDNTKENTK